MINIGRLRFRDLKDQFLSRRIDHIKLGAGRRLNPVTINKKTVGVREIREHSSGTSHFHSPTHFPDHPCASTVAVWFSTLQIRQISVSTIDTP
jgi:hypothetical protein